MTLLVRDAVDIVVENVAWHLAQGVDHVIATDNGSSDGTAEALEPFARDGALTLLHEPSRDYLQDVWTTRMALMARDEMGADWVICNDADEFWCAPSGRLHDVLPHPDAPQAMLVCQRHNMVGPRDALLGRHWADALVYRPVSPPDLPRPPADKSALRALRFETSFFQYRLPPKMLLPTRGLQRVKRGAHEGVYDGAMPAMRDCRAEIVHYPVRSMMDFERSVRQIGGSVRKRGDLPKAVSWKSRRWLSMIEDFGSAWPAYREALPSRAQVAQDLRDGRLVVDNSMSRALRDLPASRLPARAYPAVARVTEPDEDGGTLVLVTGPDPQSCAKAGRCLLRLGATPPIAGADEQSVSSVQAIHAAILAEIHVSKGDPAPTRAAWFTTSAARALRVSVFETLLADFADLNQAVLVDTALCRLLPLWRDLARERRLGVTVMLVVSAPPPAGPVREALCWARKMIEAERGSREFRRVAVLAQDLASDWRASVQRVDDMMAQDLTGLHRKTDLAADAGMRDGPVSEFTADGSPDVVQGIADALQALAAGDDTDMLRAEFDRLGGVLDRTCRADRIAAGESARQEIRTRCRQALATTYLRRMTRPGGARKIAAEVRAAPEFDPEWYLSTYPDVATSGMDPAVHFARHGAREGRNPGPGFDTLRYYQLHPDVLEAGHVALLHYCRHGRAEGRATSPALPD